MECFQSANCTIRQETNIHLTRYCSAKQKNRRTASRPCGGSYILVEMVVLETTSENPSTQLSTGVFDLLGFPRALAGQQAGAVGSSWFMTGVGTLSDARSPLK